MSGSHAAAPRPHFPHVNPWLLAVVALAAGLIALGTWVLVDRDTSVSTETQTPAVNPTFAAPDPAGDATMAGGPDLTSVAVSSTATTVTFRLTLTRALPPGTDHTVGVLIDVPPAGAWPNPYSLEGVDYSLQLRGPQVVAVLTNHSDSISRWVPAVTSGRTVSISVDRRQLGDSAWINFVAATSRWRDLDVTVGIDTAPAWNRGSFYYRFG